MRKAKGQGAERREEILDHAQRLFAAHGVQSVSTRQIADAVGVSQPTLYAYFPRRSDLLDEVCVRAFAQLEAGAQAALDEPGDPIERGAHAYIRFGLQQPDAYRIAFMLEGLQPHANSEKKPGARAFGKLREAMSEHLGPDHPELEAASQSLWAAMHGLVSLLLARPGFPWIDQAELIDHHVGTLMRGLPSVSK